MASKLTKLEMRNVYSAELFRKYRNKECYTQEYLAKQLGISQSTYQRIETGEIKVSTERLAQIADILGQPINVFFEREHDNKSGQDDNSVVTIQKREFDLMRKIIEYQEKRIEELEVRLKVSENKD
jgi:transcriptional regulator with XRE-family HTH domain